MTECNTFTNTITYTRNELGTYCSEKKYVRRC